MYARPESARVRPNAGAYRVQLHGTNLAAIPTTAPAPVPSTTTTTTPPTAVVGSEQHRHLARAGWARSWSASLVARSWALSVSSWVLVVCRCRIWAMPARLTPASMRSVMRRSPACTTSDWAMTTRC